MNSRERDCLILGKIIAYCDEINRTQMFFGCTYDALKESSIYRNAVALCILQIGELAGTLSENLKESYPDVPWRNIKGMRNVVAHKYGDISIDTVWEAITEDIPVLREYCQHIISELKY